MRGLGVTPELVLNSRDQAAGMCKHRVIDEKPNRISQPVLNGLKPEPARASTSAVSLVMEATADPGDQSLCSSSEKVS